MLLRVRPGHFHYQSVGPSSYPDPLPWVYYYSSIFTDGGMCGPNTALGSVEGKTGQPRDITLLHGQLLSTHQTQLDTSGMVFDTRK